MTIALNDFFKLRAIAELHNSARACSRSTCGCLLRIYFNIKIILKTGCYTSLATSNNNTDWLSLFPNPNHVYNVYINLYDYPTMSNMRFHCRMGLHFVKAKWKHEHNASGLVNHMWVVDRF